MMSILFEPPRLSTRDESVIKEIDSMRLELSQVLRVPHRWQGGLRKSAQAKAIRGSNSIEGYLVSEEDAAAAVDDEPALSTDQGTWAEIIGYRRVLTYVLRVGTVEGFKFDEGILKSMHFMLLEHDLSKDPGNYRTGPIYVMSEKGSVVYTAPEAKSISTLIATLVEQVNTPQVHPMIGAAMAHLNAVMIHPFRDGNGRMGRALQTLILAMDHVLEPTFSSIEEWLGANTDDYYSLLAVTGAGEWNPQRSTKLWITFILRAHHMQAQTLRCRFNEASQHWASIDEILARHRLPERIGDLLFDAGLGFRVTRPRYLKHVDVDERQATRDLTRLTELELLVAHGHTKGRYYTAGPGLLAVREQLRQDRQPVIDPYPELMSEVRAFNYILPKPAESLF